MKEIHCDSCGRGLGDHLYGKGGVEEVALIVGHYSHRLPDILCRQCMSEGYSIEHPKDPTRVYGREYEKYPPKSPSERLIPVERAILSRFLPPQPTKDNKRV